MYCLGLIAPGDFKRVDDLPVWSVSCFYIRKGYRRRGVTSALITAALEVAKQAGAPALEAYPLDANLTPSASHTGYISTFKRARFKVVARHVPQRPIMRYDFQKLEEDRLPPNSNTHSKSLDRPKNCKNIYEEFQGQRKSICEGIKELFWRRHLFIGDWGFT